MSLQRPIRLRPDNFTPPSRTPWGGTRLLQRYKRHLAIEGIAPGTKVGESWELSASEEFPSSTETGELLGAVLAREPVAMLGDEARAGRRLTSLLVKWLDAGDNLSLQIHPEDDYPGLGPGETGKLEAWYVVDCDAGAGLYLGWKPQVTAREVEAALAAQTDLSALMAFRGVARGDFVLLEPGTPHAVGKGLTLIEPQCVVPGKRAVTYRYWDWNRRYAQDGTLDPSGQPRALHVRDALAVTRWERAADPGWLASRCISPGEADPGGPARLDALCGPAAECMLASPQLWAARLHGTGTLRLPAWNSLRALTVVEGEAVLGHGDDAVAVAAGTTAAVPACAGSLPVELRRGHALLSAAVG